MEAKLEGGVVVRAIPFICRKCPRCGAAIGVIVNGEAGVETEVDDFDVSGLLITKEGLQVSFQDHPMMHPLYVRHICQATSQAEESAT